MIAVQNLTDRMRSFLDAESSDRYTFEQDFRPAINSAVEWLQAIFNKAFADKKLTEENLRELVKVAVFQTNQYSRVDLGLIDDSIWSILRVNPEPVLNDSDAQINDTQSPEDSLWRNDLSYVRSDYAAKLLTLEQWEESIENIFVAGNITLNNTFKSYGYLNFVNYNSTSYSVENPEIEVRPYIPKQFLAVTYLKYPTPVTQETDMIEFPQVLVNLVYQKALNFVAYKQGDNTNLYSVTDRDVNGIVQLMV